MAAAAQSGGEPRKRRLGFVAALRGEMVGAEGRMGHFKEARASWAGVPRKEARRESRRNGRGRCARKKESWRVGSLGQP